MVLSAFLLVFEDKKNPYKLTKQSVW